MRPYSKAASVGRRINFICHFGTSLRLVNLGNIFSAKKHAGCYENCAGRDTLNFVANSQVIQFQSDGGRYYHIKHTSHNENREGPEKLVSGCERHITNAMSKFRFCNLLRDNL